MRYLSLFSGMEAATIAWRPLGWECVGVSEIDPAACAVLRHRLPGVPNLGSVTEITDADIAALGPIDVVIGGSPCQDLSVAGKRAGLAGERSNLFHEQLRIFNAARTLCGARWLIWENVPGAFSTNKGGDFAVVVGAMAGCELPVPADGWGSEGVALGDNGLVEWAVLNSEWFGVAQRRNRVFAVLDTGDWANRPPVLLEPDSLRGDSPPRREAGEGVAGTLAGGARRSGGYSYDDIPQIATVCMAHGQGGAEVTAGERSPTLTCNHEAPIVSYAIQAGALRQNIESGPDGVGVQPDIAYTLEARAEVQCIAFDCKASGQNGFGVGEIASTMRSMGHDGSHANAGGQVAVAFQPGNLSRGAGSPPSEAVFPTLKADRGLSDQQPHVMAGTAVRRLTPRECERLQAAPDDWTLVPNDRGKPMADGPRYKMCGNSFTSTVIRWIGEQIEIAHGYSEERATA